MKLKTIVLFLGLSPLFSLAQTNPLMQYNNSALQYDKFTPDAMKAATNATIKHCDELISKIIAVPAAKKSVANTLMVFDELSYYQADLGMKLGLVASTYADDAARNTANDLSQKLGSYGSDIFLNEQLYKALKAFSTSPQAKTMNPHQRKFLHETLIAFEVNGMKLDKKGRDALKIINDKVIAFGNQFDKNLAEFKDSIQFEQTDLAGVPVEYLQPWKRASGKYMLTINGPNLIAIQQYATMASTRKAMYDKYQNRAYPANMSTLDSLFKYRQKLADQLGFKTYAAYALVTKMAKTPENVWNFLDDLQAKLSPDVTPEMDELKALKHADEPSTDATIHAWDIAYYSKKLLDTKYKLNIDEVKQYFEMNNTINGMFAVYQKLFNIKINEVKGLPVWSEKVKSYELWMDGKKMGTFFLDLYPRPNKYTHFETAPISLYRVANGKEVLPVGTLICNFPEGSASQPSLLEHGDVITMFHEFGHLIHFLLCHPVISQQYAFGVKGDFVEAPSQFLENFCWNYNCLKLFAKNYKTGEVLPKSLFDKMKTSQNAGVAIQYIRQVMYAKIDFTYEDRYNSIKNEGIDQVEKDLYKITQVPYPTGTHFICGFNHLNGYGANYYGYLWSKVYAQDIFSVFEQHGVLDQATGVRYRQEILQEGAQQDEMAMLRHFLGREPNSKAFLKSLGIK